MYLDLGPQLEVNSKSWVTGLSFAQFVYFWWKCVYFSIFEWWNSQLCFFDIIYKLSKTNWAKLIHFSLVLRERKEKKPQIFRTLDIIDEPLTAFVRLEEGIIMPNALEIPLPMRFIFLLLTPKNSSFIDCHEVGRSFSALMSNRKFHNVCYGIEG